MSSVVAYVSYPILPAGSPEHRRLLAEFFIATHLEYDPDSIAWPALAQEDLERLTRLPFWQEAVSTENITSNTVTAAAALERDPQLRRAIALQGLEERRHARLLAALTAHYAIPIEFPAPYTPVALEEEFLFAGFGECFDSLLCVRTVRAGARIGLLSGRSGARIRTGDAGGSPPHPVLRQLGESAPRAVAVVEAAGLSHPLRMDHPEANRLAGEDRAHSGGRGERRSKFERKFHADGASGGRCLRHRASVAREVPHGKRPASGALRSPVVPTTICPRDRSGAVPAFAGVNMSARPCAPNQPRTERRRTLEHSRPGFPGP